eukprot:TRINITY_DN65877_c13_g1_i1.p1 TRINITY_DN65877_c13_g1~~TRINITY_DN65877_c13_g1_i1.p1  ORF type:complete len:270 (-),score=121.95 TRINITY_DN65877_c13_g1_i1:15-791(-)
MNEDDALLMDELGIRHEVHWPLESDQLAELRALFRFFARGGRVVEDDSKAKKKKKKKKQKMKQQGGAGNDGDSEDGVVNEAIITPVDLRRVLALSGVFVSRKRCAQAIVDFILSIDRRHHHNNRRGSAHSGVDSARGENPAVRQRVDAQGRPVLALSFRDFVLFYATRVVPMVSAVEIKDSFRMLDEDGIGHIPAARLFKVFKKLSRPEHFASERQKKRWAQEIKNVFKDGFKHRRPWHEFIEHGSVSYDEYVQFMTH